MIMSLENLHKGFASAGYICIRQNPEIRKKPSIAETLDWARTLVSLNMDRLQSSTIERTLNILLKSRADQRVFREQMGAETLEKKSRAGLVS